MTSAFTGFTDLLGGGDPERPLQRFRPAGFNAGGIDARFSRERNQIELETDRGRQRLVEGLSRTFGTRADQLNRLLQRVRPGFGGLTSAGVAALGGSRDVALQRLSNTRRRTVGNLRENLQRRRVLGSSFASDAIARAESEFAERERELVAEFGEREAMFRADAFARELEATQQLIQQEADARGNEVQTLLNELNLQSEVAANLATAATGSQQQIASLRAQMIADSNAGIGAALGAGAGFVLGGPVGAGIGAGIGGGLA